MIAASAAFVIGHPLHSLYVSNQNTKFLHGLALAFPERLASDWTATTTDGLPVFSGLVYLVARAATPAAFYGLELALQFIVALSLISILRLAAGNPLGRLGGLVGAAMVVALTWEGAQTYLQGVAGQYITLGYLQPASFGALFLLALGLAQRGHAAAVLLAAIPAALHAAYIAPAILLTGLFLWDQRRRPLCQMLPLATLAAIALAAPPLDLVLRFHSNDPEMFQQANAILAFTRIPHHSLPEIWFNTNAMIKTGLVVAAIALAPAGVVRKSLVVLFGFAALGTLTAVVSKDPGLALIAPWRVSIILVPAASAVLGGVMLRRLNQLSHARLLLWGAMLPVTVIALLAMGEGAEQKIGLFFPKPPADHIAFVQRTARTQDVYLTSPDDSRFRLAAMAAQFVSWKTHPYLATEVLEWNRRIGMASAVFGTQNKKSAAMDCAALTRLLDQYPVTHVVLPPAAKDSGTLCPGLSLVFDGQDGAVARVDTR